jgi:hypothetical protein
MEWIWAHDYELARQVLQRGVAAIFLIAFISSFNQFPALAGERGLLPAPAYLRRVSFRQAPSVFHWHYSDRMLRLVCLVGAAAAASVVLGLPQLGPPWVPLLVFLLMWALYLSIVNVGQTFYGFGWESLLLEAGFIVAFLGSNSVPPPLPIIVLCWWLVFRLEFGAGMIKMRGGEEWRNLTALEYHHETQPMPGPLSRFAHLMPSWFHRGEAVASHTAQLVVPWFLFAPVLALLFVPVPVVQAIAGVAAVVIIGTQLWLVATGNFAWLNWLSIVLAFSAIADPDWLFDWLAEVPWVAGAVGALGVVALPDAGPAWFAIVALAASALLVVLSWRPLRNLFSRDQLMNASFNPLHLVNAYGAFGTVTKERYEIIIEGASGADAAGSSPPASGWRAYEFKGKPGDVKRRPSQVAPYHLRLDWLMWFLALGREERWFDALLQRLLQGDPAILRLLRSNPFPDAPPAWVRARVYAYRFATREDRREHGQWWMRTLIDELGEPVRLGDGSATDSDDSAAPADRADVDPDEANAVDVGNEAGDPDESPPDATGPAENGQDGERG